MFADVYICIKKLSVNNLLVYVHVCEYKVIIAIITLVNIRDEMSVHARL